MPEIRSIAEYISNKPAIRSIEEFLGEKPEKVKKPRKRPGYTPPPSRPGISAITGKPLPTQEELFRPTTEIPRAIKTGLQASIPGMMIREQLPEEFRPKTQLGRLTQQAATLFPDLPFYITGGIIGGAGGPITAAGGAFALPAGIRKVLMDKYEKGEVKSAEEFFEKFKGALAETSKGYLTGLVTGVAGKVAPRGLKFPAQIGAMTTVPAALEGQLPEPQDFQDAFLLLGALKVATATPAKLRKIYSETGKHPKQVAEEFREGTLEPEIERELKTPIKEKLAIKPIEEVVAKPKVTKLEAEKILDDIGLVGEVRKVAKQAIMKGKKVEKPVVKPKVAPKKAVKEPWEMTKGEFEATFWYHGKGRTHPFYGKEKITGGVTKNLRASSAYADKGKGTIDLIRHENLPIGAKEELRISIIERGGKPQEISGMGVVPGKADFTIPANIKDPRKYFIEQALKKGESIPKEVLAEYPDLVPKKPPEAVKPTITPEPIARIGVKEEINELYSKAIEIADEAGNKIEAKRLQNELKFIGGTITTPLEMRKLRQTIHAWKEYKGLTKKQLTEIVRKETGHLSTLHKAITAGQLKTILGKIAKVRPRRIGFKTVIKKETENRIITLKQNLMSRAEITEESYTDILDSMRITEPIYISKRRFITESKGKEVLDKMLKAVPIAKMQARVEKGVKEMPAVQTETTKLKEHFKKEQVGKALKRTRLASTLDMHHFSDLMEKQTGQPFGQLNELISEKKHKLDWEIDQKIDAIKKAGGEAFINISKDEVAIERINDYIASKLSDYVKGKPKYPKDITEPEIAVADAIIKRLKEWEGDVRYNRFYEWREHGVEIPNAPKAELTKATKILETQGDTALRKWLAGRDWGVIRSGYDIGEVISPTIKTTEIRPGFGKRGLRARESIQYHKAEKDILRRFASYERQMTYRTEMKPLINAWVELFESHKHRFKEPGRMADLLTRNVKERLGQKQDLQVFEEYIIRAYSQAARAIFLDLRKGIRNLFQNLAFYPSMKDFVKMKPLSSADKRYFKIYVSQEKGIARDWLYQDYKGVPGLGKLNKIADIVNVMGRTDTANRLIAFKMKLESVRNAIKKHPKYKTDPKELTAMMKKSKWGDLQPMERLHALNLLATKGEDAMVRSVAHAVTKKVHFLYERSERSPAEQGTELSRVASNLLTFRKGYVQRAVLDFKKILSGQKAIEKPIAGRRRAVKSISGMIIMGAIAGWIYQKITGDKRAPYSPVSIIGDLSLGGLATGMQEQIGTFTTDAINAVTGDKEALGRVINNITKAGDSFIPFYNDVMNAIEGFTDYKGIDRAVLRQIRSALDDRYNAKPLGYYEKNRDAIEAAQHILFGTEVEKAKKAKKIKGVKRIIQYK